jgi:hypothetical protein
MMSLEVDSLLVTNYNPKIRDTLEECRPQLHRGGSLKSRKVTLSRPRRKEVDNTKIGCKVVDCIALAEGRI